MNFDQTYKIDKDKVSWRIIDGEAVILNLDNGLYYDLNKTGTAIWQAIAEKKSLEQILEVLKKEYSAGDKRLENDLKSIVADLEKEKLIKK